MLGQHRANWQRVDNLIEYALFLLVVAVGAYIQTQTGFAMALIILSGAALLDLAEMPVIALVVSLLAIANTTVAIRGASHLIALRPLLYILAGAFPAAILGLWFLQSLAGGRVEILKAVLGATLVICCILLAFKPRIQQHLSGGGAFGVAGIGAGLIGGLFGVFGPPLIFVLYRQPMELLRIRTTLQAVFLLTALYRTVLVSFQGQFSVEALTLSAAALPVVIVVTLLAPKYQLPLERKGQLRLVYALLVLMGCSLMAGSYASLLSVAEHQAVL